MTDSVDGVVRSDVEKCLLAYTRGVDRLDAELIASAFHPDAELDGYGRPGAMTVEAFVERAIPSLRDGYRATQHRISNLTIEHRGDHVATETYVLATHVRERADEADQLLTFCGRYIDRFEPCDGEWRIATRSLRVDWTRIEEIEQSMPGDYIPGARDLSDVSYP